MKNQTCLIICCSLSFVNAGWAGGETPTPAPGATAVVPSSRTDIENARRAQEKVRKFQQMRNINQGRIMVPAVTTTAPVDKGPSVAPAPAGVTPVQANGATDNAQPGRVIDDAKKAIRDSEKATNTGTASPSPSPTSTIASGPPPNR